MNSTFKNYIFKVLLSGVRGSGINSLISTFGTKAIVGTIQQRLGVDFFTKKVTIGEDLVYLQFWVMYQRLGFNTFSVYLNRAQGVMFMFDVSNPKSFEPIGDWVSAAREKDENMPIFIIGNKSDLHHEIEFGEAEDLCRTRGATYANFMSVKTGQNVEAMFALLGELVLENHKKELL
ncbi:MAG: Rab family GTPase [Promethearchaeota archaeon]